MLLCRFMLSLHPFIVLVVLLLLCLTIFVSPSPRVYVSATQSASFSNSSPLWRRRRRLRRNRFISALPRACCCCCPPILRPPPSSSRTIHQPLLLFSNVHHPAALARPPPPPFLSPSAAAPAMTAALASPPPSQPAFFHPPASPPPSSRRSLASPVRLDPARSVFSASASRSNSLRHHRSPTRGRSLHSRDRSTFLNSPSTSPIPHSVQGPPNPVRFVAESPVLMRDAQHFGQPARPRPLTPPLHFNNNPKTLGHPDRVPSRPSSASRSKRRATSLNRVGSTRSSDPGCIAGLFCPSAFVRKRSSSARGRSLSRAEERNSLLEDFQGYAREDSPRTTVSKRMSELGLLESSPTHSRQHTRGLSSVSAVANSDVASRPIAEEPELSSMSTISPNHVASQQRDPSPRKHPLVGPPRSAFAVSHLESERDSERKLSDFSDMTFSRGRPSATSSFSLFPAPEESPVSPMSPTFVPAVSRVPHSPKRPKRPASPLLGPRPVSPARAPVPGSASNFSRKPTAPVPRSVLPASSSSSSSSHQSWHRRTTSPPLTAGAENPLVWHDSEITGHLMLDPDDDGTGINGVGFKPSRGEEEVRRIKRKQQVEAWKAREGRADRDERARRRRGPGSEHVGQFTRHEFVAIDGETRRIVRFVDGK